MPTDNDLIAQFMAKKGATVCAPATAYGLDPAADKAKRRETRDDPRYSMTEQRAEIRQQRGVEENGYYKS